MKTFILTHSEVVVIQSLSHNQLFATPWTAPCQASLSFTISRSLLKLMSIESVMPSNQLIFCHPLFLLPSIFPSIRVFSNESVLHIRWPKYWSFSFSQVLSNVCLYFFLLLAAVVSDSCDPMDCSPPGFSVNGILQARRLE